MTLRSYLWGIKIIAILSLSAWVFVVFKIDPEKSGLIGQILFFGSLFLAFSAIFTIFLIWIFGKIGREEAEFLHLGMSFRQGMLLAVLAIILLVMQNFRVLTWWDGLLAAVGVFLVELYFLSR